MRLRSLLFVPADRPDRMEKALAGAADAVIFDLEDSVAETKKAEARAALRTFLKGCARIKPILIRINPLSSGQSQADLQALAGLKLDGIVLPKAEGRSSIEALDVLLHPLGLGNLAILPIATETPAAIFELGTYRAVGDRLLGLTWGAEDLPAAIGATISREPDGRFTPPYETARALTLFAAHAAGVAALETVYPDFKDLGGLSAFAARAAGDGFDGMMAIHPTQIEVINRAFAPSVDALAKARAIVEAFARAPDAGALSLDGQMIDAPHLKQARRILARAED